LGKKKESLKLVITGHCQSMLLGKPWVLEEVLENINYILMQQKIVQKEQILVTRIQRMFTTCL
jgi:hypothetical protein